MSEVNPRRRYTSPVREESALRTRSAIVTAALELFVEQGYAATTIDQIAARAQVSKPTVFAVGSKAQLLKLARDAAIAGDHDPIPMSQRPSFLDVVNASDSEQAIRGFARFSAGIAGRFSAINEVLRQASTSAPELAELWRVSEQERLTGARNVITVVTAKGPLKPGLDADTAADILWLLMAPEQHQRLVGQRGWTFERFAEWYADTMVGLLLP
jgi:AcrR family transcriptional regulator